MISSYAEDFGLDMIKQLYNVKYFIKMDGDFILSITFPFFILQPESGS